MDNDPDTFRGPSTGHDGVMSHTSGPGAWPPPPPHGPPPGTPGGPGPSGPPPSGGRGRLIAIIAAVVVLLLVAGGTAIALVAGRDDGEQDPGKPTDSQGTDEPSDDEPSDEPGDDVDMEAWCEAWTGYGGVSADPDTWAAEMEEAGTPRAVAEDADIKAGYERVLEMLHEAESVASFSETLSQLEGEEAEQVLAFFDWADAECDEDRGTDAPTDEEPEGDPSDVGGSPGAHKGSAFCTAATGGATDPQEITQRILTSFGAYRDAITATPVPADAGSGARLGYTTITVKGAEHSDLLEFTGSLTPAELEATSSFMAYTALVCLQ